MDIEERRFEGIKIIFKDAIWSNMAKNLVVKTPCVRSSMSDTKLILSFLMGRGKES